MQYTFETFLVQPLPVFEGYPDVLQHTVYNKAMNGGVGYKILTDGKPFIVQDCEPGLGGWVPMTQERAAFLAQEHVLRLTIASQISQQN